MPNSLDEHQQGLRPLAVVCFFIAGLGAFILIGQVFVAYPAVKVGIIRLVVVVFLLLLGFAVFDVLAARNHKKRRGTDLLFAAAPAAAVGVLLLFLMIVGAS